MNEQAGGGCGFLIGILFLIWLVVKITIWIVKAILVLLTGAIGIVIVAIIPCLIVWLFIQVFKQMRKRQFERLRAIFLPILTILFGINLGFGLFGFGLESNPNLIRFNLQPNFNNPWLIAGTLGSGLPLLSLLLYPSINRRKLIRRYRDGEQHLIEP